MYGIVNKAIQGLVTENFGIEAWEKIKIKSGVEVNSFLSNEPYPDQTTFDLAVAASDILKIELKDILISFGEYWVLKTGQESYGSLMKAGGDNLKTFLINLPNFHSRVMLIYPNLTPPEFKISNVKERALFVHYFSTRNGLQYFMYGLLQGLAKMYGVSATIKIIESKSDGADHDIFEIKWKL